MSEFVSFGETMLRLSAPPNERLEFADRLEVHAGGAESNAAVAAERLGVPATWLSKLPDSPLGRRVVGELEGYGLETAAVWSEEGRQGVYYLEQAGRPRDTNVVYDRENAAVTTTGFDELPTDRIREAELFLTSGITPALSSTLAETTASLLEYASEHGTTTAFDFNYRRALWEPSAAAETLTSLFPAVDVLVIPERDARSVLGLEVDPHRIAEELESRYGFETVVVTLGADGALARHGDDVCVQEAYQTDTVDPIGTGDAFTGAFLARRLRDEDLSTALEWGVAAAALKRTIPGDAALISPAEIESVLENRSRTISR